MYLTIGWIIVVGFAATLVITLLSLVGKITIEEQYKKALFTSLVLEIVAAGFFIFKQGPGDLDKVKGYFLFNLEGEPIEKVVSTFQKLSHTTFKNIRRTMEINATKDTIFFKTTDKKTYLGFSKITDELVSPEHKLYAGLYLCTKGDVKKGKPLLIEAIYSNVDHREKREGIIGLYKIMKTFNRIELDSLITWTDRYTDGNAKYKEIADINSFAADKLRPLDVAGNESLATIRDNYRIEALYKYLYYLKIQRADSENSKITQLRQTSLAEMNKLFERLRTRKSAIYKKKDAILTAVQNHDINDIESYRDFIIVFKSTDVANKL